MWIHEHDYTGDTLDTISAKFKERFEKNPPTLKMMPTWESKLFKTGNARMLLVHKISESQESCKSLEQSIINSPLKWTSKRSVELGIQQTTRISYLKKEMEVKAWQPSFVNKLSDADRE